MKKFILLFISIFLLHPVKADEGMWLPLLLKSLNESDMQSKGCKLSAEDIFSINKTSLKDAIVLFGGGCTGEIISKEGLLLTNHHCGFGQIQKHSSVENDYLTEGFWAKNKAEELPNPGLTATFIISMVDVSNEINDYIKNVKDESTREKLIQEKSEALIKEAKQGTNYDALIKPFFNGNQFYLFTTETFTDIRLVGAPPSSIGKFGDVTDNWMWPRHAGDFALFRIYAGKDNKPAPYSKDNIPFTPRYHFTISLDDIQEGDFTMVYGFPGRTYEYLPTYAIKMIREISNPARVKIRDKRLEIMHGYMRQNDTIRIKYAAKSASVANAYKKWQGENKGIDRVDAISKKQQFEKEFLKRAVQKNIPEATTILLDLELNYSKFSEYSQLRDYYMEAFKAIELLNFSQNMFLGISKISNKQIDKDTQIKEIEKLKKYSDSFYKDYDSRVDCNIFAGLMTIYYDDLKEKLPYELFNDLKVKYKGNTEQWAKYIFEKSLFVNQAKVNKLLKALPEIHYNIEKDPALKLFQHFDSYYQKNIKQQWHKLDSTLMVLNRKYMAYQMELMPEKKYYPDANSTLRVAYGNVSNYSPKDGVVYETYTTLEGVMEKESKKNPEFYVHPKLKKLFEEKDYGNYADKNGKMRIDFIASNHTTGGNSGSPVLNAHGELIGTNFDRNWEGTVSDIMYDKNKVRNIIVDIHYTLFIIDKFAGATHLINELSIKKRTP